MATQGPMMIVEPFQIVIYTLFCTPQQTSMKGCVIMIPEDTTYTFHLLQTNTCFSPSCSWSLRSRTGQCGCGPHAWPSPYQQNRAIKSAVRLVGGGHTIVHLHLWSQLPCRWKHRRNQPYIKGLAENIKVIIILNVQDFLCLGVRVGGTVLRNVIFVGLGSLYKAQRCTIMSIRTALK